MTQNAWVSLDRKRAAAGFALLAALAVFAMPAAAADKPAKQKKERATLTLPVIVEAAPAEARSFTFREGEFWGWQTARYRSVVTLSETVPIPELWAGAAIEAGDRLVELKAESSGFSGPLFCTARQRVKTMAGTLMCLADRDGDGAMDRVWTGGAASLKFLVPFPYARSVKPIRPVTVTRAEDPAALALQLGFYVSGTNPIFGTHHFYPMLSSNGELGFAFTQLKNSVTLKALPNSFRVGGAELRVEAFRDKTYRATVTRPYPPGERDFVGEIPTQTIYVSVPG